jgi:hypothetical protein
MARFFRQKKWRAGALGLLAVLAACGGANTPLDADTRQQIDSLANEGITRTRLEVDSLCQQAQHTQLPHLVDSIKKIRLREIEEQLRTVPK